MAQHNPDARAYLMIVLGGIVVCFVIAGYLLGVHQSKADAKMGAAHSSAPSHVKTAPARGKPEEAQHKSLEAALENSPAQGTMGCVT